MRAAASIGVRHANPFLDPYELSTVISSDDTNSLIIVTGN